MQELPRTLKLITVWLLLGTVVFVAAQAVLREREKPRIEVGGGSVTLLRGPDRHFHWPGQVNGQAADLLVDTGATRTTLPGALARTLDLPRGETVRTQTAAGTATGYMSQVELRLQGGPTLQRWPVIVIDAMDGPPLLGMDLLSQLRLVQDGQQLQISPR